MGQIHLTVAAIIEHQQKFVLVSDMTSQGIKLNQPAGHVEDAEDILVAVVREVKEETSLDFIPRKLTGVYLYHPNQEHTYLRFCFSGSLADYTVPPHPSATDQDVVAANWYSLEQIKASATNHRSGLVMQCINDYLAGSEYPLQLLATVREAVPLNLD